MYDSSGAVIFLMTINAENKHTAITRFVSVFVSFLPFVIFFSPSLFFRGMLNMLG